MDVLNCCMFNARSVRSRKKLDALHGVIYGTNTDCCIITESWLTSDFPNGLLDPDQCFDIYRCDRVDGTVGGGVCVFVSRKFKSVQIHASVEIVDDGFELVLVDITSINRKLRLISIYRQPRNDEIGLLRANMLVSALGRCVLKYGPTILVGDLNCPSVDWASVAAVDDSIPVNSLQIFANFATKHGFIQCVQDATRGRNILDVVLVNEPLCLRQLEVVEPFYKSDHNTILFSISLPDNSQNGVASTPVTAQLNLQQTTKKYLWKEGNYEAMNEYLFSVDWDEIVMYNFEPNTIWHAFQQILEKAVELFVPSVEVNQAEAGTRGNSYKHYPRHIKVLLNRKRCLWRKFRTTGSTESKLRYEQLSTECRNVVFEFEKAKEAKVIESSNTGDFFKYVNKKLSYNSGVGALRNGDEYVTDDAIKAEILNAAFLESQQHDDGKLPKFDHREKATQRLESIDFSPQKIYQAGRRIKPKLSKDPDGFTPYLLTKILPSLTMPLSTIFQSFMSTANIPTSWKRSIITPIFKKGLASDPNNYRPIAITSIFSKLMERVIVQDVSSHLRDCGLISKAQHGFIKSRSTTTNLLDSVNDWTLNFSSHTATDVAYIDFAKAFDKVCHTKLMHKLECYGICGDLLRFLHNFLSNRKQCTKVGNNVSSYLDLKSGVIQGSCVGPLLFVIYINDIADCLEANSAVKLYADDIKLYTCIETTIDINCLQRNLNSIYEWANLWQMQISIAKCFILPIGGNLLCLYDRLYRINNAILPTVFNMRDLGVIVDSDLTFGSHVDNIVSRASIRANLIIRCFISGDRHSLVKAFTVYVRPILEFNSSVWSPRYRRDNEKVESVQRHFTKRLAGLENI